MFTCEPCRVDDVAMIDDDLEPDPFVPTHTIRLAPLPGATDGIEIQVRREPGFDTRGSGTALLTKVEWDNGELAAWEVNRDGSLSLDGEHVPASKATLWPITDGWS